MHLILLCVSFGVAVSVLLKLCSPHSQFNLIQAIFFNYLVTLICTYFFLSPTFPNHISLLVWTLTLTLGVLLPSIFVIMGQAISHIGLIKTDIAQRLALFLSLSASFYLFKEAFTFYKFLGILCALLSGILLARTAPYHSRDSQNHPLLHFSGHFFSVCIGYGVIDVLFRVVAQSGIELGLILFLSFAFAALLSAMWFMYRKEPIHWYNLWWGSLLGLLNFSNIYFYVRAHQYFPSNSVLVFTAVNLGVIFLSTLVGKLIFNEPLTGRNWLGVIGAVSAFFLLSTTTK